MQLYVLPRQACELKNLLLHTFTEGTRYIRQLELSVRFRSIGLQAPYKDYIDMAVIAATRSLPHAVELEGIHFTLPEIQTLLDGITVGGHKLSDQQIAVNQGNVWRHLKTPIPLN